MAGLYKVFEKIGNSYKIKLLDLIKVHLVFSLDKLWKALQTCYLDKGINPPCQFKLVVIINGKLKKYWPVNWSGEY